MKLDERFGGSPLAEGGSVDGEGEAARELGGGWRARLDLNIALTARGGSGLRYARHEGPLRVQRPFFPEGREGPCHVYVLHPPGGIVDGDALTLSIDVCAGASALITTPGASKFYRARSRRHPVRTTATVRQQFRVEEGARLEWFPHETIAFSGSRGELATEVSLAPAATYLGCELFCLGRPAAAERFDAGELRTSLRVSRGGELRYFERGRYRAGDALLERAWGLGGRPVFGTLVLAAPNVDASWVEAVRSDVEAATESDHFAVTLVSGLLIARFIGASTRDARLLFERTFSILRPYYAGRKLARPRIWST